MIRRPKSRRVRLLLPGGFTLLKWFPLKPPRTYFVSLDKTKHSSAEVLLSVTVRVRAEGSPSFRSTKQVLLRLPSAEVLVSSSEKSGAFVSLDKTSTFFDGAPPTQKFQTKVEHAEKDPPTYCRCV